MRLEEVHFNHDTGSTTGDAINLCRNGTSGAIIAPEWKRGLPSQPEGQFFNMHTRKFLTLAGDPSNSVDWEDWA